MNALSLSTGNLHLIVGYDGSPPAIRALERAARLLHDLGGSIEVVYVAHLTTAEMMSAGAIAEMEASFEELAQELHDQASEQLRGLEDRWRFERGRGVISDVLITVAQKARDTRPGDDVVIVVGSSSHGMHRMVGSVAVSLARHAPVPVLIVP